MSELLQQLSLPFHPSRITWKPQSLTKDKARALAVAYADLRVYMDRLDELCGMDWSVSYTPWGDRIICHLTIGGVTRSSTGEGDASAEKNDIGGTAAEAQAFKRAAVMFGMGRYLYDFPTTWVDYSEKDRGFTPQALSKLNGMVASHYRRVAGEQDPPTTDKDTDGVDDNLYAILDELGAEVYADQWPQVKAHNIKRITGGDGAMTSYQIQKLINGLNTLKNDRVKV